VRAPLLLTGLSAFPERRRAKRAGGSPAEGSPDDGMCCNGRVTSPPKEKAIPNPPGEWPRIATAKAGSVILRTVRPDADNRRSYFFTDALQILATDQMNEIPGVFESVEKALQTGHYVAGFVSYEAGYHFDRSDGLCGRPGRLRRSAGVVRHIPGAAQLG
jgi:hypothetical protein